MPQKYYTLRSPAKKINKQGFFLNELGSCINERILPHFYGFLL